MLGFALALLAGGLWAMSSSSSRSSSGTSGGSAWARARGATTTRPASTRLDTSAAAELCARSADALDIHDVRAVSAWAECPGRSIRDLRVVATRLERAATDETNEETRAALINAHVAMVDWISRRERETDRAREEA